ncbi:hypothetical protein LA76x_1594 [Lysobacter antibioticus]|uniref:Uncharacterized protein n=1 Tax=Lysobacter antibioticus TaxID=84531 RepID=A0A0S2F893_LYSAN|nr:hypothetical protein LA76x_1594 [Lysobacter antibioticus]
MGLGHACSARRVPQAHRVNVRGPGVNPCGLENAGSRSWPCAPTSSPSPACGRGVGVRARGMQPRSVALLDACRPRLQHPHPALRATFSVLHFLRSPQAGEGRITCLGSQA